MVIFIYPTLKNQKKTIRVAGSDLPDRGSMQDHDGELRGYSSRTGLEQTSVYNPRRPPYGGSKQKTFINTCECDELNGIMRFSRGRARLRPRHRQAASLAKPFPRIPAALAKACHLYAPVRFLRRGPWRRARPRCHRGLQRRMPVRTALRVAWL